MDVYWTAAFIHRLAVVDRRFIHSPDGLYTSDDPRFEISAASLVDFSNLLRKAVCSFVRDGSIAEP